MCKTWTQVQLDLNVEVGTPISLTIDLSTYAGNVVLLHGNATVVEADYEVLLALQPFLFEVEPLPCTVDR